MYMLAFAKLLGIYMYKYRDMCMVACTGYIGTLHKSSKVCVHDHCTELESEVCATKSTDCLNPYFAHNIVYIVHVHVHCI